MTAIIPGNGLRRSENSLVRIVVGFDVETFDEIRSRALAQRTSFAEQVRLLVTWGLEAAQDADPR